MHKIKYGEIIYQDFEEKRGWIEMDQIEIEIEKANRKNIIAQIDKSIPEIIRTLSATAKAWIEEQIEIAVNKNPEIIKKLNQENKLSELKKEIADLIQRLPQLINNELSKNDWPHNKDYSNNDSAFFGKYDNYQTNFLEIIYRNVITNIGPILGKYHLINEKPEYTKHWEHNGNGVYYMTSHMSLGSIESFIDPYNELFGQVIKMDKVLRELYERKNQQEASELWKNA